MKKLATIILTLMVFFTSCKPEEENNGPINDNNTNKIKVSCTIPINDGKRSDFTNLFEDGIIKWSDGRECVYLAIPGDEPKIVELEGYCDGHKPEIEFIAYIDENTLTAGESYDIWYFGHSQQLENPYVSLVNGNKIEGSIAKQTGRLEDLGYSHIASTSVTAVLENGEVKLPLVGTLKNRMAIALLDISATSELYGSAVNTEYTLEYNVENGKFEFNVIEDENTGIEVESTKGISYIALLPNENTKVELKCEKHCVEYEYTFYNGIKDNKIYYRLDEDSMTHLKWNREPLYGFVEGYEYVDLGLPSGTKWAICNIGASTPEEYGDYLGHGFSSIPEGWSFPDDNSWKELIDNCVWEWITLNDVNGYHVVGPNGSCIFLPAAGYTPISSTQTNYVGTRGYYWSSDSHFSTGNGKTYYHGLFFSETSYVVESNFFQQYSSGKVPIRLVMK